MTTYVPCTPAGTLLLHIAADSREKAIENLLDEAGHKPYEGWQGFEARGYTIEEFEEDLL